MIYSCIESVELELNYLNELSKHLREFLHNTKQYNNMYLNVDYKNGVRYYHRVYEKDGKRSRRYVGKAENQNVRILQKRAFAKKALEICDRNIKILSCVIERYRPLDPTEIAIDIGKAYREGADLVYEVLDISEQKAWLECEKNKKAEAGEFLQEGLKHVSGDGIGKRSKGEVIIANILMSMKACYIYEPIRVINGKRYRPDFVVYNSKTGEEIIVEYMGKLQNADYREDAHRKIENYILGGYTLGKDLIIFMDNGDGNIDSQMIKRIMEAHLK